MMVDIGLLAVTNSVGRQLAEAIGAKQGERIKRLIRQHRQLLDYHDKDGVPLLLLVAEAGMLGVVEDLLLSSPTNAGNSEPIDQRGDTASHRVITSGLPVPDKLILLEVLADAGADLNAANHAGDTPMHVAAILADLSSIEFLRDKVDVSTKNLEGLTPLDLAQQHHSGEEKLHRLLVTEQSSTRQSTDFSQYLGLSTGIEESIPTIDSSTDAKTHWWLDIGRQLAQWQHKPVNTYQEGLLLAIATANFDFRFGYPLSYPDVFTAVQRGLDVNATDENGRGSLFWSLVVRRELGLRTEVDSGIMNYLIDNGAELDVVDIIGKSLAHVAAYAGDYYALKELVDRGVDLYRASDDGLAPIDEMRYPLQSAVILNDIELLNSYLDEGHAVNYPDADGNRAIHLAAQLGNLPMLKILQEHDADLEAAGTKGYRAIHFSAEAGHLETSQFLIEQGIDVNARSQFFFMPTQLAQDNGHTVVVELLQANGGMLKIDGEEQQQSLNAELKDAIQNGDLVRVKELVRLGAEIHVDLVGGTALHYAAISGWQDIFTYLIESGANINVRVHYDIMSYLRHGEHLNRFGKFAQKEWFAEDVLTERYEPSSYRENDTKQFIAETPILSIIRGGDEQFLSYALSRGAEVNATDGVSREQTGFHYSPFDILFPLTLALLKQQSSMVDQLLQAGASPYALPRVFTEGYGLKKVFAKRDFVNRRYSAEDQKGYSHPQTGPWTAYKKLRISVAELLTLVEQRNSARDLKLSTDSLWNLLAQYGIEKEGDDD